MATNMTLRTTLVFGSVLAGCATGTTNQPAEIQAPFEAFTPERSSYLLGPGDRLDITVYAVPEFSRSVVIGPDGRISMPMVDPIQVADLSLADAKKRIMMTLAGTIVDPTLDLSISEYAPKAIFVGGEVGTPGVIDMPGQIDALQAIIMAGGFTDRSSMQQVLLLRRVPGEGSQTYSFDVKRGIYNAELAGLGPLQRFDVIYVPTTRIVKVGIFFDQYLNALPVDFRLSYELGNTNSF